MFDTSALGELIADNVLFELARRAVEQGSVRLLVTHVQEDELDRAPAEVRERFEELSTEGVPTSNSVLGVSRLGDARLGPEATWSAFECTVGDGLIAATAHYENVVLVTEDQSLQEQVGRSGLDVSWWSLHRRFRAFLAEITS